MSNSRDTLRRYLKTHLTRFEIIFLILVYVGFMIYGFILANLGRVLISREELAKGLYVEMFGAAFLFLPIFLYNLMATHLLAPGPDRSNLSRIKHEAPKDSVNMLTDTEADTLDKLSMSAVMSITAAFGLMTVPEAVQALERAMPEGYPALFVFSSRLSSKYDKTLGIKLPVKQFSSTNDAQEKWMDEVATLIASGFLGSAYELLEDHRDPNIPLWEFFRHTRNAAFHGNRFHFLGDEPKRPASWRGLEITRNLQDTPLFFDFIHFADVFYMLADLTVEIGMPPGEPPMFGTLPEHWTF